MSVSQARKRIVKFEVDVLSVPPGLMVELNITKGSMDTNILTNVLANLLARAVCQLDRKETNDALINYMKYVRNLIEELQAQMDVTKLTNSGNGPIDMGGSNGLSH